MALRIYPAFLLPLVASLFVVSCTVQPNVADRSDVVGSGTGQVAAHFSGTNLAGQKLDSSSFKGHAVVIDFWASWCGPCRSEQIDLNNLDSQYSSKGVDFVGVVMRDDAAQAQAYHDQLAVPYQSVLDADSSIASNYNVAAPPTVVVVDKSGHIAGKFLGTVVGVSDILR